MADGGYLAPPSEDEKASKIWTETKKRVDRFLPDLFTDIFPQAHPPSEAALAAQKSEYPSIPPTKTRAETAVIPPAAVDPSNIDRIESSSPNVTPEEALA